MAYEERDLEREKSGDWIWVAHFSLDSPGPRQALALAIAEALRGLGRLSRLKLNIYRLDLGPDGATSRGSGSV